MDILQIVLSVWWWCEGTSNMSPSGQTSQYRLIVFLLCSNTFAGFLELANRLHIFTADQRSGRKVMFSGMCLCVSVHGKYHVTITHDALMHWTETCRKGFNLHLTGDDPPDMFKLIHYEARTVDKQAVYFLLECFLVLFCDCKTMTYGWLPSKLSQSLYVVSTRKNRCVAPVRKICHIDESLNHLLWTN